MTHSINRRTLLGSGIRALSAATAVPLVRAAEEASGSRASANEANTSASTMEPTLGDYTMVFDDYAEIPMERGYILTDAPSLVRISDGALLCSVPLMIR